MRKEKEIERENNEMKSPLPYLVLNVRVGAGREEQCDVFIDGIDRVHEGSQSKL